MKVQCPDCKREFPLKPEYAGRRGKCRCGKRIRFPEELWTRPEAPAIIRDDLKGCVREDATGFEWWPAERLQEMTDLLIFQIEMLPVIPRPVIEKHYSSTGLWDPVEPPTVEAAVANLIQHIQSRVGSVPTAAICHRSKEQCFVEGYDYLHFVQLQVIPKDRNQPLYFAYRIDSDQYLVDRPRW